MRIFLASGRLSRRLEKVPAHVSAARKHGYDGLWSGAQKDEKGEHPSKNSQFDYTLMAMDANCAAKKVERHFDGLVHNLRLTELHYPTTRVKWDEKQNRFYQPHPTYCDTVRLVDRPQHPRMAVVNERLTASADLSDLSAGWTAGMESYSARKKLAAQLKANKDKSAAWLAGFARAWERASKRKAPKVAAKAFRKTKKTAKV